MKLVDKLILGVAALAMAVAGMLSVRHNTKHASALALQPPSLEQLKKSVVRLVDEEGHFFCSGTIVRRNTVLTAAHCLSWMQPGATIIVQAYDGHVLDINAHIEDFNERADIGLVSGNFSFMPTVDVEMDSAKVISAYKRNNLQLCGYPWGGNMLCSTYDFVGIGLIVMRGNSYAYPGMSGGPVFDMTTGKIIGTLQGYTQDNFIVVNPTNEINDMLQVSSL